MLTQVLALQLPISMHWCTGSLAPKYEEVKLASIEEGMAVNLHAGHVWAPQVACPPARVEESCSMGTRWRQLPNSEGQTWLHKVSLVGSPLLLLRSHLPHWDPQGHVRLRTWGQDQNYRMEGDGDNVECLWSQKTEIQFGLRGLWHVRGKWGHRGWR